MKKLAGGGIVDKIDARSKSVRELLEKVKYNIDYYQREYKWKRENVITLLDDLEGKFRSEYEEGHEPKKVQEYPHYFLGSIIVSHKNNANFIVDGQQRLTTLTLLLLHINNLQSANGDYRKVDVKSLIFSEKFGAKSFNIDVAEREPCMEALFNNEEFDTEGQTESIRNILSRYNDIVESFPATLKNHVLPYFIDWLVECVDLVEIVAYSDDDAYAIFETMNDRGLRLTSAEMLKGYLLANIAEDEQKRQADELWRKRNLQFYELAEGDESEAEEFFKAWLRSQYAESIRERKKGSENKDWEILGTRYHKWVRDEHERIGLKDSRHFSKFVFDLFDKYSTHYLRIWKAAMDLTPGLEYVYYNAYNNFTLQDPVILAAITEDDDAATVDRKIRLVAGYIDIYIARRVVNFRTLSYSSIVYSMFNLMTDIRHLAVKDLAVFLKSKVDTMEESFEGVNDFYMHQLNHRYVHFLLARITHHIAEKCGLRSDFASYLDREAPHPFQVEHIWSNKYEQHKSEFGSAAEFEEYRNRLGGLLLLPDDFNKSYGKKPYNDKLDGYYGQSENVLAKSLHPNCYQKNPSFLRYVQESGLRFKPYPKDFTKQSLGERQDLCRGICKEIWSTELFDAELE